jgi:hypothetical protein
VLRWFATEVPSFDKTEAASKDGERQFGVGSIKLKI